MNKLAARPSFILVDSVVSLDCGLDKHRGPEEHTHHQEETDQSQRNKACEEGLIFSGCWVVETHKLETPKPETLSLLESSGSP